MLLKAHLFLSMTDSEILIDKSSDDEQYDFQWKLDEQGEWREFDHQAAHDELKMGKWTDINPQLLHDEGDVNMLEERQVHYKPCKDQFINFLGFQAGYLKLEDTIDLTQLLNYEANEQSVEKKLLAPEKSLIQWFLR